MNLTMRGWKRTPIIVLTAIFSVNFTTVLCSHIYARYIRFILNCNEVILGRLGQKNGAEVFTAGPLDTGLTQRKITR